MRGLRCIGGGASNSTDTHNIYCLYLFTLLCSISTQKTLTNYFRDLFSTSISTDHWEGDGDDDGDDSVDDRTTTGQVTCQMQHSFTVTEDKTSQTNVKLTKSQCLFNFLQILQVRAEQPKALIEF